jgi:hypothetical protein
MKPEHWRDAAARCFGLLLDGRAQTSEIRQCGRIDTTLDHQRLSRGPIHVAAGRRRSRLADGLSTQISPRKMTISTALPVQIRPTILGNSGTIPVVVRAPASAIAPPPYRRKAGTRLRVQPGTMNVICGGTF